MARNPTVKVVSFDNLSVKYGAVDFQDCLADFIAQVNYPGASAAVLHQHVAVFVSEFSGFLGVSLVTV